MIVSDASALLGLVLEAEDPGPALAVLAAVQAHGGIVPAIFWFEIRHVLLREEKAGRSTAGRTTRLLALLGKAGLRHDPLPPEAAVLDLARRHRLSVYDASYLELASRLGLRLATLDRRLRRAADAEAVPLLAFGV